MAATLDTLIAYLNNCRAEFGGDTQVVLSAEFGDDPLSGEFISLDQIPGIGNPEDVVNVLLDQTDGKDEDTEQ